jgi:hypothetical protein
MVCKIIDECRCYAYKGRGNPMSNQFCAVRRGPALKRCTADCCAGGCPGQVRGIQPRQPFRIIEESRPMKNREFRIDIIPVILVTITVLFLLYAT